MLTFTQRRNLAGKLANDSSSATLSVLDTLMNAFEKKISKKFNFLETSLYASTVASQQFYELPNNFGKLKNITVTIGTTKYQPQLITSRDQWDNLNSTTSITDDVPQYCYIFDGRIGFYPIPSSATTNAIYIHYHKKFKDLSVADYTTGTITSVAVGGTAVVGSSTVWTAKMAGMAIQITDSSTANTGDGVWYEIESVESATTLTLRYPYQGIAIEAGTAAYTIGQISYLPEDIQILPVFKALVTYFASMKPDVNKLATYTALSREMETAMMENYGSNSLSPVCSEDDTEIENPNNFITGS